MAINLIRGKELPTGGVSNNESLAEQIREKRRKIECTEEMIASTRDIFEKAGYERVTYPQYTKDAMINIPTPPLENEMKELMDGYYAGTISKEDIKDFFAEYADAMFARDEGRILNLYESFLNRSYESAVKACFEEGKDIARAEGKSTNHWVYYNADYYYRAEEIHDLLKEAAKEYGAKYGIEVDTARREEAWQGDYLTGTPSFHSKWNFRANIEGSGRMMDQEAVPPEGFSFFYTDETALGAKDSLLIISGKDWTKRINVPFDLPISGKKTESYFYLADLLQVDRKDDEQYKYLNDFLNKFVIIRNWGDVIAIERR